MKKAITTKINYLLTKTMASLLIVVICLMVVGCGSELGSNSENSNSNPTDKVESTDKELTGKSLVDWFVSEYNKVAPTPITNTMEVDVTDRESGHYRTEFRLHAFQDSYSETGKLGSIEIDIVTYGHGENDDIRLYVDDVDLTQAKEIIKYASPILDRSLTGEEIQEVLDYLDEHKSANGHYYGNIGLVYAGDLMIKKA